MTELPIDSHLEKIARLLQNSQNLILHAEPGAGKTTRLPPYLMKLSNRQIWVLEPRRVVAVSAAERVCEENHIQLGQDVGYQVKFNNKTSTRTKLIYITEALFLRKLHSDPELKTLDILILDEFHERSIHTDLAISFARELQEMGHPLKIIVMSATLDSNKLKVFLGKNTCEVTVPGKTFPLITEHTPIRWRGFFDRNYYHELCKTVRERQYLLDHGNGLIFLPGKGEIDRTIIHLSDWANFNNIELLPLHGALSLEEQRLVLKKSINKRVILTTNIAESSVTVDGVSWVIDCGLCRVNRFDPRTLQSRLEIKRISKASATQRAGRAARTGPGHSVRMWSVHDETQMPNFEVPEILRSNLSEHLLLLADQGVRNFESFSWFERPPAVHLQVALNELVGLDLLNKDQVITPLGREALNWPLPPREAKFLSLAAKRGFLGYASELVALIKERDILDTKAIESYQVDGWNCDLRLRHQLFLEWKKTKTTTDLIPSALRAVQDLSQKLTGSQDWGRYPSEEEYFEILFECYKDQLCKKRDGQSRGVHLSGRGVALSPHSLVQNSEFFVPLRSLDVAGQSDTSVEWATSFNSKWLLKRLEPEISKKTQIIFEEKTNRFVAQKELWWKTLLIDQSQPINAAADDIFQPLVDYSKLNWKTLCHGVESLQDWLNRWQVYSSWKLDVLSAQELVTRAIESAAFGKKSPAEIFNESFISFIEMQLDTKVLRDFRVQVPKQILVPSGNWISLQFKDDLTPFLQVRLQELFGLPETPRILGGKIPILLELLAPNYRPVQVTSDLESFWKSGYFEVKKELKTRYPKHSWPDNPLEAKAIAKGPKRPHS